MNKITFKKTWKGFGSKSFPKGSKFKIEATMDAFGGGFILHRLPQGKKRFIDYKTFENLIYAGFLVFEITEGVA